MRFKRLGCFVAVGSVLAGCSDASSGSDLPFRPIADVQTLMATVVDPAADVYWDAVGWIVDSTGTTEIRPESEEEWEAVRNAAYQLAESGNLMMMQGRGAPADGAWTGMSQAMIEVSQRAILAAEAMNEAVVFDVGAEMYAACTNCHARYALETLPPSFESND